LTCDSLEGLAGAATGKAAPASAEAIRKALMAHLEQAPVTVRIRLGQSRVTISELMKLEAGDVLLLDKSVDQPAEVLVKDRLIMSGFPAACEGQYALQITSRAAAAKK